MSTRWKSTALSKVAVIERSTIQPAEIEEGTPYLGLEHIESGGKILGAKPVDAGELASSKFRFSAKHVLYGKLRPYLAKITCPDFTGICSTDILPILPGSNLDRRFLCYFLRQPSMVDHANSRTSGANLPRLSPTALAEIEIPLPPLAEQKRIAGILDAADALRAKRRESLAQLDSLLQSTFLTLFGDPVSNPLGWEKKALGRTKTTVQIGPFGSLLHQDDYIVGGVPLVNPMHIINGKICPGPQTVSEDKAVQLTSYRLALGDVVMGRRGEMGRCSIVSAHEVGMLCGTGSLFIRPHPNEFTSLFLASTLSSASMKRHLESLSQGVTMANLNSSMIEQLAVPLPPLPLQRRFAAIVESVERQKARQRAHLAELDALFASIQHRAFRGEL